jgi:hypothetical protein
MELEWWQNGPPEMYEPPVKPSLTLVPVALGDPKTNKPTTYWTGHVAMGRTVVSGFKLTFRKDRRTPNAVTKNAMSIPMLCA